MCLPRLLTICLTCLSVRGLETPLLPSGLSPQSTRSLALAMVSLGTRIVKSHHGFALFSTDVHDTKGISFCQSCFESISVLILYLPVPGGSMVVLVDCILLPLRKEETSSLWVLVDFLQALFLRAGQGMGDHANNTPNVHGLTQLVNAALF